MSPFLSAGHLSRADDQGLSRGLVEEVHDQISAFERTTEEAFDPGSIPAYTGAHPEIYAYVDAHLDAHLGVGSVSRRSAPRDSPVLRLVQALASMTTPDGNTVLIPGYYDGIRPPTEEEERLINGLLRGWDAERLKRVLAVERFIDDLDGREAILRYLYDVTLNVDGIWGGYTGEGTKTILPHKATAKVDSRLPPGVGFRDRQDVLARFEELLAQVEEQL